MKSSRAFTPTVVDSLETRCVPAFLFSGASHALVVPHAVVPVPPVVHKPGTFSQGANAPFFTAPNGEKLTLNSRLTTTRLQASSTSPTTAAVVVTPRAVVTVPPVVHKPGTFSQGANAPFFTAPNGEKFTLHRF